MLGEFSEVPSVQEEGSPHPWIFHEPNFKNELTNAKEVDKRLTSSTIICEISCSPSPPLNLRITTPVVQNMSLVSLPRLLSPLMVYPTDPSSTRSSETRADTAMAERRLGCVTRIDVSEPRPDSIMESRIN